MERNSILNQNLVLRSMHREPHRFDPYHHPKWQQYRNRQTLDTDTVCSEDEYYANQAYAVTRRQGNYYFDLPRGNSEIVREDQAFHDSVARIRATQSQLVVHHGSYGRRIPLIQTISPSLSAAGLSPSDLINPARLRMIMEEETLSGTSTSPGLPVPANISTQVTSRPDISVVSRAATAANTTPLGEQPRGQSRPAVSPQRLLDEPPAMDRTAAPVNGPFMRVTTRELQAPVLAQSLLAQAQAATKRRDIESILATLKARLKHANMQSDRLEVCRLSIERQDVRQVLHEFNTERNPKEMPSRTQAAAPAIEAPPSVSGQANANNIHASASSEQGPEEILIEAISQIGQLRRKVADLEGILNVENMSTAAEGLSMALVGTARELLMQTKEVTGYARSQERRMAGGQRGGGQRGGGQRLLTEYDDEYDEEYDSDSGIIEE